VHVAFEPASPQDGGGGDDAIHCIIGCVCHSAGEKDALHASCAIVFEEGVCGLFGREGAASGVESCPQRAVAAVIDAFVGDEGFEKECLAPVLECDGVYPLIILGAAARVGLVDVAGAGEVVLRFLRQYGELLMRVRGHAYIGRADRFGVIACGAVVPHGNMILPPKSVGKDRIFDNGSGQDRSSKDK